MLMQNTSVFCVCLNHYLLKTLVTHFLFPLFCSLHTLTDFVSWKDLSRCPHAVHPQDYTSGVIFMCTYYFLPPGNNTCFYGKCYYCRESEPACAEGEIMEGSLTLWLPDVWPLQKHRHPWGRTYREGKLARWVLSLNGKKVSVGKIPLNYHYYYYYWSLSEGNGNVSVLILSVSSSF